uniref:NADH-ubiquinone oxidoreductase chain 4L n=1 Tax=Orthonychiurus folsomi TaxID=2581074 RepID=A0A650DR13_9HEXA|nr:NADH dehydrogenase subunit 4L [Orthonychiurus folsomi]
MMFLVSLMIIMAGLWVFSSKRKHVLLILLSLEFMVLGIYSFLLMEMNMGGVFFSILYLGFSACEGALGLTILVVMSRTHGGDSFNLFNLN